MKYLIIFLFLLCVHSFRSEGQIQLKNCGNYIENNYYGASLYAIKDASGTAPFGQIVFTPTEGGAHWVFRCTHNGIPVQGDFGSDSTSLEVVIPGDGFYIFEATRHGVASVSKPEFHIFYDHVPDFTIHLSDKFNCTAATIDAITDFVIPVYRYQGNSFNGDKSKIYYKVSGKDVAVGFDTYDYAFMQRIGGAVADKADRDVTVTITDKFGFEWTSRPDNYPSVIPTVAWELELGNTVDVVGEVQEQMGQAPLEVAFRNRSTNASECKWYLFKDTADFKVPLATLEDSLIDNRIRTEPEFYYTYENPGRYKVQLVAINATGNRCWDTIAAKYVNVVISLVDVPNVFTPNGDGKNDIFKARSLSVESFQGVILNRWGRKVHEWSDPEEGWDGRINGKYANPGTYFYIITARGREKNHPPRYVKKGALLLVR